MIDGVEDLLTENIDSATLISEALFWSEQADEREMETVLDKFKDSPQDQLILMKIRFEQRIIQVKQIIQEQG